jgi:glycosyltransferase involved in cell wall biosynthesis
MNNRPQSNLVTPVDTPTKHVALSIVVPLYNEEANIEALYKRLKAVVDTMGVSYEFVFVNDGSRDRTLSLAQGLSSWDKQVRYIDLSRNFGHQIAVTAGLDHTIGDAVVIIDADLQDPPELIPELYNKLLTGYEVVYAKRLSRPGENVAKLMTAKLFYRTLASITNVSIPVDTGDFRIISRKVVEALKLMPEQNKFLRGQISWIGFRQTYVEYAPSGPGAKRATHTTKCCGSPSMVSQLSPIFRSSWLPSADSWFPELPF